MESAPGHPRDQGVRDLGNHGKDKQVFELQRSIAGKLKPDGELISKQRERQSSDNTPS